MPRVPERLRAASRDATLPGVIASLALVLGVAVWVGVGAAPWLAARITPASVPDPAQLSGALSWWTESVARAAARAAILQGGDSSIARAHVLLQHSLRSRPLYAPTWMLRGEVSLRLAATQEAARWAELSRALWPRRERHLWRVALLQGRIGPVQPALRTLRDILRLTKTEMGLVVYQARRLEPDATRRAVALLPDPAWSRAEVRVYLERLLHLAARDVDLALAARAWRALPEQAQRSARSARRYVDLLIEIDQLELAQRVWHAVDPNSGMERVANAGFEAELAQGGFGWHLIDRTGVRWTRDRWVKAQGGHSLRIAFTNLVEPYRHASQRVRVRAGVRYRLRGRWRGQGVSAHARPYLEIAERSVGVSLARSRARSGTWDWADVEVEFWVPENVHVVEIALRRDARPERVGEGRIWLDAFALERVDARGRHG